MNLWKRIYWGLLLMGFPLIRVRNQNINTIKIMIEINMIDLHTHILPNIDDGASDLEEALKMTESLRTQNIMKAVCTPHFDPTQTSLQAFIKKRTSAMDCMSDSKIDLICGSETMLHDYLFHYSEISGLCIENTRYLLVELPFRRSWDIKVYETLEKLISYFNVIPIIAHVERYQAVKKNVKCIKKLIDMGCVIQLNTSSIMNKKSMHQAVYYIKHGYIDVLGSDCHNMKNRPPIISAAFDIIEQKLGFKYCAELRYNAQCIVSGIEIRKKIAYKPL